MFYSGNNTDIYYIVIILLIGIVNNLSINIVNNYLKLLLIFLLLKYNNDYIILAIYSNDIFLVLSFTYYSIYSQLFIYSLFTSFYTSYCYIVNNFIRINIS